MTEISAQYHLPPRNIARAERDLTEAMRIATRGGIGCISLIVIWNLSDSSLRNRTSPRALEDRQRMIERMGYHRRDNEVNELGEQFA